VPVRGRVICLGNYVKRHTTTLRSLYKTLVVALRRNVEFNTVASLHAMRSGGAKRGETRGKAPLPCRAGRTRLYTRCLADGPYGQTGRCGPLTCCEHAPRRALTSRNLTRATLSLKCPRAARTTLLGQRPPSASLDCALSECGGDSAIGLFADKLPCPSEGGRSIYFPLRRRWPGGCPVWEAGRLVATGTDHFVRRFACAALLSSFFERAERLIRSCLPHSSLVIPKCADPTTCMQTPLHGPCVVAGQLAPGALTP